MTENWIAVFERLRGLSKGQDKTVLLDDLLPIFAGFADEYNRNISQEALMITVRRLQAPGRLMITNSLWALSIRAASAAIECFLLPTAEMSALMEAELPSRCKLRVLFGEDALLVDGVPLSNQELGTLLRSLLKDLIVRSQGEFERMPDSTRLVLGGQSLTGSVRSLVAEKHVLVQKIVSQQELILAQVARELHDAVLGNMMVLERSLSGGKPMPNEEMILLIKEASTQLREICHDLYPRDLKDCGLAVMLEELAKRLEERIGCKCKFTCSGDTPELPDEVLLHFYRIAQECINNIAKHSLASTVEISLESGCGQLKLCIKDDGRGIAPDAVCSPKSGTGSSIIRERTELIDCILPATLLVSSKPGQGTQVSLQVDYGA